MTLLKRGILFYHKLYLPSFRHTSQAFCIKGEQTEVLHGRKILLVRFCQLKSRSANRIDSISRTSFSFYVSMIRYQAALPLGCRAPLLAPLLPLLISLPPHIPLFANLSSLVATYRVADSRNITMVSFSLHLPTSLPSQYQ